MWSLSVKLVHIPRARNQIADGLSRTIFDSKDCEPTPKTEMISNQLKEHGLEWIWRDGKGGYEALLKRLSEKEREEVQSFGTLNGALVLQVEVQFMEDWDADYRASAWFCVPYLYHSRSQDLQGLAQPGPTGTLWKGVFLSSRIQS